MEQFCNLRDLRIAPSTSLFSYVQLAPLLLCELCVSAMNNPDERSAGSMLAGNSAVYREIEPAWAS